MDVKPGYKQTEVGVIPEDWEVKNLGALVSYTNGMAHEQSITDSGRFVVVNSKFISSEGSTRKYSDHCFCPASKGDVLMVMSDVPNGRAIAKCYWVESQETYTVNQRICILSSRSIDGKLLFYKLDRNPFYLAFDDGAKQTNLRKVEVLSCPLGIPTSDNEQRTIAGALSDVDALIGALDQLIAKKRDLKQAAMQQILTGQKRLPGFHREWQVMRFSEVSMPRKERVDPRRSGVREFCVELEHIEPGTGKLLGSTITGENSSLKSVFREGDVLFGKLRAYLRKFWLADCPGVCSTEIWVFVPNRLLVTASYLFQLIKMDHFIEAASPAYGTHMPRSDWNVVKNYELRLPPLPEQTAIAEVLSDMDAELAALEQRRDKTRALKQGMMRELLTGRTRLV